MPYTVIEDFRGGLDSRRSSVAGVPGTLVTLNNAHITRGGEIEKRKAFSSKYTLPAGTVGIAAADGVLYVFGHATDPGVPSGVTYQQLAHPDGSPRTLSAILGWDVFDGKVYVSAKFDDDSIHHFYDGSVVADWGDGVVRSGMTNTDGIAEHLRSLIDADDAYTATRSGSVITVEGAEGEDFSVAAFKENVEGGTDDQDITIATTQISYAPTAETPASATVQITSGTATVQAQGSIQITGGSAGAGNQISTVGMGSGDILDGNPVLWATSDEATATALAAACNENYTTIPGVSSGFGLPPATGWVEPGTFYADGDTVFYKMQLSMGAGANSGGCVATVGGTVTVTNSAASSGVGPHYIGNLTVGGTGAILAYDVYYTSSDEVMAANLAFAINQLTASTGYSATVSTDTVTIIPPSGNGASENGKSVATTVVGSVGHTTSSTMSGGVTRVAGQNKKVTITIGGTFEVGDRFGVRLNDTIFGAISKPTPKGTAVITFKSKIYSAAGSLLQFSGVNTATGFNRDTTDPNADIGAGFINMASQARGSENLTALGLYQGSLAVFSRDNIQIWSMNTDPDLNVLVKVLDNTGTRAVRSVLSFGDNDTFYLDESGVRSLKPRDSSGSAFVGDVGNPIDTLVQADLASLTDAQIEAAVSLIEPEDDRYWLVVGSKVYVFSFFPSAKISAWSTYSLPGESAGAVTVNKRVYVRSGNVIYLYGGDNGATYDSSEVTVTLPYLTAGKPATEKHVWAFGVACTNTWRTDILVDPSDPDVSVRVGDITGINYTDGFDGAEHWTTHFAPKMVCSAAGSATISNLVVHYHMSSDG